MQPEEVGDERPRAVKTAGYDWVATTVCSINTPQTDSHRLHRIYGDASRHWLVMAAQISGIAHQLMTAMLRKNCCCCMIVATLMSQRNHLVSEDQSLK